MIYEGFLRLNTDAISHSIFLVKLTNVRDPLDWYVGPITTLVKSALRRRIREWERGEQILIFDYLAAFFKLRQTAGLVFESLAQSKLQKRVKLELLPMVKWTSNGWNSSGEESKEKGLPRWYSNHEKLADSSGSPLARLSLHKDC